MHGAAVLVASGARGASASACTTPLETERAGRRASRFEQPVLHVAAIACSAGGIAALRQLLGALPHHFPAAIVVLLHWPSNRPLHLESVRRSITLPMAVPRNGQAVEPGIVFFAAPGRHLLLAPNGRFFLSDSPRLHFMRPSADLLFESLAATYRKRAIAVILTGAGRDGSIGVKSVKAAGGTVIAQNEATAKYFQMPEAAIQTGCVDLVLALPEIASTLLDLVAEPDDR